MPTLHQVLLLVSALTLAILSPGPAIISATQTAFSRGRGVAVPYGMGLAFGASLWGLCALLGLTAIFAVVPALYLALKVFGGIYLLWMAWGLWRGALGPVPEAARNPFGTGFLGGIALNLSNPKPALFYAALILSVFPEPMPVARQALVYALCLATELFWYALVAVLMSTAPMRARYFAAKFWIDRAAGIAMGLLGLLLIVNH